LDGWLADERTGDELGSSGDDDDDDDDDEDEDDEDEDEEDEDDVILEKLGMPLDKNQGFKGLQSIGGAVNVVRSAQNETPV
jgi:hypothetical protein